jgi:hypothetical protein
MRYYVRITYFDDTPPDMREFDTREEAMDAFRSAVDMRANLGARSFGDCDRVSVGSIVETRKCIADHHFN